MLTRLSCKNLIVCAFLILFGANLFSQELKKVRNPFCLTPKQKVKKTHKTKLKLIGIVASGKESCAIIATEHENITVQKGQIINGYLVKNVGNNVVILQHGKKSKKLFLD